MEKHKHYNEIIAWAEGKEIESRGPEETLWHDSPNPSWYPNWEYRVKDPYRELKEAFAAGKTIQFLVMGEWRNVIDPTWVGLPEEYRVKPEQRQSACSQNKQAPEPMFAKAKVDDKVFSLQYGEGVISSIESPHIDRAHDRIRVAFKNYCACAYDLYGYRYRVKDITQDLYWSKPEIIAPEKPKKMTEVKRDVWLNVHSKDIIHVIHLTEDSANGSAKAMRSGGTFPVTIHGTLTYEMEEE